jgi:NNP family nitrate/nitrite transporter-like MFS transporter
MAAFKTFLKAGHPPTLFASFLYFDFCFAIWVLNGAMAPFISEQFHLSAAEKGFMISVPILAGAIMRFPLGVLAQYIGRKNAALVEMSLITCALLYGFFILETYNDVLIMGVLLGIAGASFGVALSLGSGWFPPKYKGLAMGIAGAGNSGTVLAVLFAPRLAEAYGWQSVYGFAALFMLIPIVVMIIFAKEPPDREPSHSLKDHLKCLWDKDGWVFNLVYIITFGGFIGLSNFLPTYFHDQFGVSKIEAGELTMLAALMGSAIRVVGGWASDRWGGINTLTAVFGVIIIMVAVTGFQTNIVVTTLCFMLCFAALGAGNGALFQLVPLRWPTTTAVAGSMIGEIGALGGAIIPNAMGLSKQNTGNYHWGFMAFAIIAVIVFAVLRIAQVKWTKTWVEKGGRAKINQESIVEKIATITLAAEEKIAASVKKGIAAVRSVIYPVGHSQLADKAASYAAKMCNDEDTKVVLLYVEERWSNAGALTSESKEWESVREQWVEEGKKILHDEAERLKAHGVHNIELEIRHGDVASEVCASADEHAADMILLASHQTSPVGQLLMGSRTYNIFKKTNVPILRIVR